MNKGVLAAVIAGGMLVACSYGLTGVPRRSVANLPGPTLPHENVAAPLLIAWFGPDHWVIAIDRMAPGTCCYEPPTEIIAELEFAPEHPLASRIGPGARVRPQPPSGAPQQGE